MPEHDCVVEVGKMVLNKIGNSPRTGSCGYSG
jgi:hypothetical protein